MIDFIEDTKYKMKQVLKENKNIAISISGGADSDILVDLFEKSEWRTDKHKIKYYWFNTGLEYEATKKHIVYLENKYGIVVSREKPKMPMPMVHRKYGTPYKSKTYSEFISRLQKHNFDFKNHGELSFDELKKLYPRCLGALAWWCRTNYTINIGKKEKDKIIKNGGVPFKVTNVCCQKVKKDLAKEVIKREKEMTCWVVGLRTAEGGQRKHKSDCYSTHANGIKYYYPLLHWSNETRFEYEQKNSIVHSDCYTVYGLERTGCAGCPFGRNYNFEREVIEKYEPKLFKATEFLFRKSYDFMEKENDERTK